MFNNYYKDDRIPCFLGIHLRVYACPCSKVKAECIFSCKELNITYKRQIKSLNRGACISLKKATNKSSKEKNNQIAKNRYKRLTQISFDICLTIQPRY